MSEFRQSFLTPLPLTLPGDGLHSVSNATEVLPGERTLSQPRRNQLGNNLRGGGTEKDLLDIRGRIRPLGGSPDHDYRRDHSQSRCPFHQTHRSHFLDHSLLERPRRSCQPHRVHISLTSRHPIRRFRSVGRPGIVFAALSAAGNTFFVISIINTGVANTLVIVAVIPLLTAILSHLVLAEPIDQRTWIAAVAVAIGIATIFSGSIQRGHLLGDLSALAAAFSVAGWMTLVRRHRTMTMTPALALGGGVGSGRGPAHLPHPLRPLRPTSLSSPSPAWSLCPSHWLSSRWDPATYLRLR